MTPTRRDSLERQLISAHAVLRRLRLSAEARTNGRCCLPPRERPWWRENPASLKAILCGWRVEDGIIIDTGGFGRFGRPAVVRIDRNWVVVRRIAREAGGYVPGRFMASILLAEEAVATTAGQAYPRWRRAAAAARPPA